MKSLYFVAQTFSATTAVSGRTRQLQLGETFMCDPALPGERITIEMDGFLFLVDRATFKACCKWKNEGMLL